METNKNLLTTVEKMTVRCKNQEEKLIKSKIYKQFYKNSCGFKCLLCSNVISNHLFLKHISKCNENNKTSNNSINLSKSNMSISNIDSHKKNLNDYKNSVKQNVKKHQSIHYDNEFSQRLTPKGTFDLFELGEIQIELDQIFNNNDQKNCSEFIVYCSCQNFNWKIQKRFVSFYELYQNISLAFVGLALPDSCKIFTNSDIDHILNSQNDIILEKKIGLQNFIQDLAKIDFIKNSIYFKNFLEVQENLFRFLKREKNGALKNFHFSHGFKHSNYYFKI